MLLDIMVILFCFVFFFFIFTNYKNKNNYNYKNIDNIAFEKRLMLFRYHKYPF